MFNYSTLEDHDSKRCWELSNLRLLPARENISIKGPPSNVRSNGSIE